MHGDPGLQPERTTLAWGRTMMALVTASAIFLRWLPRYGLLILVLIVVSFGAAVAIYLTQKRRYRTASEGIEREKVEADVNAVLWTALAGVALGALGLLIVASE
ncbi:DUF202 domain-containing protein [Pseudarthrobacter sp. MDT3-9]|nr:DUF202 domain-containing protein [Pseudarthrobacter sp. MDT3-9]